MFGYTEHMHVDESIQVAMLFRQGDIRPAAFIWRGQRYVVKNVHLIHKTRLGDILRWHFTLSTESGEAGRLCFDTLSLQWMLEEFETA